LCFAAACRGLAEDPTFSNLPPVVIGTFPVAGAKDVDPGLKRLKIAFSKKMTSDSYSLCMREKETFPEIDGAPKFSPNGRSCLLKVVLEPGKTYVIWINSAKAANFKDSDGHPVVPYLFSFRTADKDFAEARNKAAKAAEAWLKLVDDKKYSESWKATTDFFRKNVPEKIWDKQLDSVRGKLGELVSRELLYATMEEKLPNAPKGKYFVLKFKAVYKKAGTRVETVTPMLENGEWKVSGYFIK